MACRTPHVRWYPGITLCLEAAMARMLPRVRLAAGVESEVGELEHR